VGGHHGSASTAAGEGPAASVAPEPKIVATFAFVIAVVATPREAVWAFAADAVVVLAVAIAVGIPLAHLARRLTVELPFVVFAVLLPIVGQGERVDVFGVSLSVAGLWAAWSILAKGTLGVAASVVLSATTPVPDLLDGMRRLRVPAVFVSTCAFMIRYLDVVLDDLHRMHVARVSRGHDPRWLWQARAVATTAGALFVRTYERGERVYLAMVSRGYDGSTTVRPTGRAPGRDWLLASAAPAVAVVVAVLAWAGR